MASNLSESTPGHETISIARGNEKKRQNYISRASRSHFEQLQSIERSEKGIEGNSSESDDILHPLLKPEVKSILVKGEPGTGKTTLALELLRLYGRGIYVSTRVSKEQSGEHHPELNALFDKGSVLEINTQEIERVGKSSGYSFDDQRFSDPRNVVNAVATSFEKVKEPLIVLDSWDAIANRTERIERLKVEQSLALIASGNNAKLLFVSEEPLLTTTDYLVDAVVTLQNGLHDGRRIRKLQWNKIRGSAADHWTNLYTLAGGRFTTFTQRAALWQEVPKPQPFKPIPHRGMFYSTGSSDFDELLGGGMRKGFFLLVEFGEYVGSAVFNPVTTSIRCNFILNDGCSVTIPSPGVTANRIKESVARHVPSKSLDNSLRLGYYEMFDVDPCFFALDENSPTKSFDILMSKTKEIKGEKNDKPCLFSFGVETLEYVYSHDDAFRFAQGIIQRTRFLGDALFAVVRHNSPLIQELSSLSDVHIKIDDVDGTSIIRRLKPWSQLYALETNYTNGYPHVKLTPFV